MSTNQNNKKNTFFMSLALQQANTVLGNTKDNPAVGCIITNNNRLIAAAATSINGRPHAEDNAISSSTEKLKNSNLYVTLEPCSHYGKTPPCINRIIKNKVKKVFFSIKDPDIRSYNKSSRILKKKGIAVINGLLLKEVKNFYKSYLLNKKNKIPFVTSKLAMSKDCFTVNKKGKWITNEYSRGRVHLLRSQHDCIMTSSETVIKDNPLLSCRINGLEKNTPARIVLDRNLRVPLKSNIIKNKYKYKTVIFYNKNKKRKIKQLKKYGIKLYKIPLDPEGHLNLNTSLNRAKYLGFSRIFLETGIKLTSSFFKKKLINDFKIFISDEKLKKNGSGSIKSYFKTFLKNKSKKIEKINLLGDKLLSYNIK